MVHLTLEHFLQLASPRAMIQIKTDQTGELQMERPLGRDTLLQSLRQEILSREVDELTISTDCGLFWMTVWLRSDG